MHQPEGDSVFAQAFSSKYRPIIRGMPWKEHFTLCLWIPGLECLSINARTKETIPRIDDSKHHVSVTARTCVHAQIELFASRSEARKLAMLPLDCKNCWLWVSRSFITQSLVPLLLWIYYGVDLPRRSMLGHRSLTMWALDGTERPRFYFVTPITMHQSTFLPWVASWLNCSRWDRCFPVRVSKIRCSRYAKCWAHRHASTGLMASNLLSSSVISSHNTCHRTSICWFRTLAMKQSNSYQTCYNMIRRRDRQLQSASSIHFSESACRFQSVRQRTSKAQKKSSISCSGKEDRSNRTWKRLLRCQKWKYSTRRNRGRQFWERRGKMLRRRVISNQRPRVAPHLNEKYQALVS